MTSPASPAPIRTVAVLTLGCKLNQAESETISRQLVAAGCLVLDRPAEADAYVINSCSVTHIADRKTRQLVRTARRLAPESLILLTGCYPETAGRDLALATGADLVVPSRDKDEVVRRLLAARPSLAGVEVAAARQTHAGRTRAFIKAQEGCNDVCAFCIVPRTRGRERSIAPEAVAATVREREAEGVQEVVITGTQLGAYGRECDPARFGPAAVIRALLTATSAPRIRFSSLQPQDITPELLALWEDPRLCRHFHLALQSGSAGVLARMRRRYRKEQYQAALAAIRAVAPGAAVTTDLLVGFPGESDAEHAESLAFCREVGFAQMHVFPYSRRPGTSADLLPEHVPPDVKSARMTEALALAREAAIAYRQRFIGQTVAVLWENATAPDDGLPRWDGLTDTYVRVQTRSAADLHNRLLPVRVTGATEHALFGERMDAAPVR